MGSEATQRSLERLVSGFGLPVHDEETALHISTERDWRVFFGTVGRERLQGLALAAVVSGQLVLTDWQLDDMLKMQREWMVHALQLERTLVPLVDAFDDVGVEVVLLKGPAIAHTRYPDPAWRPFGDLDLLVRALDWDRACELLTKLGFERRYREPRPGFSRRFGHTALHVGLDGVEVDLHRTLVAGPFGLWMEPEELFDHTESFLLGGRPIRRLDDTGLFLNASVHASLGHRPPLLLPLRDVAQTAATGHVNWDVLKDWSVRWRLRAVVAHACSTAEERLGTTLPPQVSVVTSIAPPKRERRALEAYTTDRRARGGKAVASIQAIPGIRGKLAYTVALLFPGRDFMAAQAGTEGRVSYLHRWLTPVRWLARR